MDSPSSPSPQTPHEPQRLSALYQYHNAPEVAPAHGLEYDDTVYPSSDKFPVIREAPSYDVSNYKGKHAYPIDNRPPRIIFGMTVKTFLLVSLIMVLIIVGASVGGAVGGKHMRENQADMMSTDAANGDSMNPNPTATTTTSATFSAPTPTYAPLSDCPASNATTYTSAYAKGDSGRGFTFTKYCDYANPLSRRNAGGGSGSATRLAQAFVYSFSDCIDLCAGLNYNAGSSSSSSSSTSDPPGVNCSVAVYMLNEGRPYNCAVGHTTADSATDPDTALAALGDEPGTDVAFLDP